MILNCQDLIFTLLVFTSAVMIGCFDQAKGENVKYKLLA
jgi:hypothetical protein